MWNRNDELAPSGAEEAPLRNDELAPHSPPFSAGEAPLESRVAAPAPAPDAIPPAIEAKMGAIAQIESYAIQSDDDFHRVADHLVQIKDAITAWEAYWSPLREGAHAQWKKICARIKEGKDPLIEKQNQIIAKMGQWDFIREERRKVEQERKNVEQLRQIDDRKLEQAAALSDQGKPDLADAVMDQPIPYAPVIEPKEEKPAGLTAVRPWSFEYVDKKALARAALDGTDGVPFDLIQFDEKMLLKMARALKDNFKWPGVKPVQEVNFARRRF